MGLLSDGHPLTWDETHALAEHVRRHGVLQFINIYRRLKDRAQDCLKWGDEIEYILVRLDSEAREARLVLRADSLLKILQGPEERGEPGRVSCWRPEYANYMLEGTPAAPYGNLLAHFNTVEMNMMQRRREADALLREGEVLLSMTGFPRLGCPPFTHPPVYPDPTKGSSRSLYFPQEAIFPGHPRFATLTQNIRLRRGEKVVINVPLYRDVETPDPYQEPVQDEESRLASKVNHIYMDAMGFGMGLSCLQVTFQGSNIQEARLLYDQLTPICPVVLALSAACPVFKGLLSDVDARWDVISACVDCRTGAERGLAPLSDHHMRIFKSRYSSVSMYISPGGEKYNDVPVVHDPAIAQQLVDAGIDPLLAKHVAHLFIRDTCSLFSEKVHQSDDEDVDHFENIQSTNWQSMRFKPPPLNSPIGWRVEFRPTEVQLTDFENAAYVCFVVLLSRAILSLDLNFLMPISKVDENMAEGQKRDACRTAKFWFRTDVSTQRTPPHVNSKCGLGLGTCLGGGTCSRWLDPSHRDCHCVPMTVNEIVNGKAGVFPGLIGLIHTYLDNMEVDVDTMCTIQNYLKLIQRRASGQCMTTARWTRQFIQKHPEYKHDSVVSDAVCYDLCEAARRITTGEDEAPELLGHHVTKTRKNINKAVAKAAAAVGGGGVTAADANHVRVASK